MRISDWSSDVCSSDLIRRARIFVDARFTAAAHTGDICQPLASGLITDADITDTFEQIGRASCRARVCQYVSISVVAVSLQKKTPTNNLCSEYQQIINTHSITQHNLLHDY